MTDKKSMKSNAQREFGDFVKRDLVGADEWRASKIGYLTGVSSIVRGGATAFRGTGGGLRLIGRMLKTVFVRDKTTPLPTDSADLSERFRVAQAAYGRTDDEIAEMVVRSGRQAWLYAMISIALFVWAVYRIGEGNNGPFGPVFPLLPLLFILPFLARAAFWNWQLRTRRLGSVREWAGRPGEWLPPLRNVPAKALVFMGIGMAAFSILLPDVSLAQTLPTDGLPDFLKEGAQSGSDIFMRTLGVIAGGVGPVPKLVGAESPWVVPLGNAFGAFNGALLAISGAMLGWHTLTGMVSTAHEGKVLGQRWHQIWAPVRVMLGVGTLVPVSGGFATVQVIVLQIAVWGSALGNVVWSAYVHTWDDTAYLAGVDTEFGTQEYKEAIYRLSTDTSANELVFNLFQQSVCLAGLSEAVTIQSAAYEASGRSLPSGGILSASPGELERILPNQLMGAGLSYEDPAGSAGDKLSLSEVLSNRVTGEVGLRMQGRIVHAPSSEWAALTEGSWFGATPTISWNYGPMCGLTTLNLVDINGVKDYLEKQDDADRLRQAYAVIEATGNRLAARIDQEVHRPVAEAARRLAEAALHAEVSADADADRLAIYSRDGMVAENLTRAYVNYQIIVSEEMRRLDDGIYGLIDRDAMTETIDRASSLGWSSAGAFYLAIGQMVEHDLSLGMIAVNPIPPNTINWLNDGIFNKVRDDVAAIFHDPTNGLHAALDKFKSTGWAAESADQTNEDLIENFQWEALDVSWWEYVHIFLNKMVRETLEPILWAFEPDPFNAMVHMVAFGQAILGLAFVVLATTAVLWTTSLGAKLFGESIDKWPLIGSLVGGGSKFLAEVGFMLVSVTKIVVLVLLAVGLVHAYLIPMLPYVFMLFFVTGMLILIGEGLVAAPIWAFMHVRMDGQDFVDQVQKPGYMIAFNLLLRPALAVFGLALSMVIFSASIFFMNETFHIASQMAMPDAQGLSFVAIFSMLILQVYLHYQIAIRSFQLIVQVPDRVTRWFGQGGENLNEDSDSRHLVGALVSNSESRLDRASGMAAAGRQEKLKADDLTAGADKGAESGTKPDGGGGKADGGAAPRNDTEAQKPQK